MMMMMRLRLLIGIPLVGLLTGFAGACAQQPEPPGPAYPAPELKYILIARFPNLFYVDRDFYPVAREGQEEKNALEQFSAIRSDNAEFQAILTHLALADKAGYTSEEKLLIYREHKKLSLGVEMTPSGNVYRYVLRVGDNQGEKIEGTITPYGKITVLKREPSFNTYPICLAEGTLIDAPGGPLPVERLRKGMTVWTADYSGVRVQAAVLETIVTPVPAFFQVVRISLSDGRSVTASQGHPSADLRALGGYRTGDTLDGASVITVELPIYNGGATYDLLPDGPSGLYWANGVLLKSTLTNR
jgi:hypothetical protein